MVPLIRGRWHWLIPTIVIFGLLTPILFTDRTFATDWSNHLWLIWAQGLNIRDFGQPSYFLQSSLGAFYPYYAFYGGTLYAALGLVSGLSNPETAVAVAYLGALTAAYLGWTWIAKQVGIRGWQAQLPGCIAVTAPLAVTNLYGRGDIPEVVATSMLPLVAASALALSRERQVRLRLATVYVVSIVVLTGTHTLTLVWGTSFLLLCGVLVIACNWKVVRSRAKRGITLLGLTLLGVGVNGWILTPLILYHGRLKENKPDPIGLTAYTDPSRLFSLLRNGGNPYAFVTADVNAELPVLALAWALVCGAIFWCFLARRNKRLALGLLAIFAALVLLILSPTLIEDLPEAWRFIQFPYRILTYADLCVVGLVTLVLAALQTAGSRARIPVLLLAAVAVFNFGLSVDQNFHVRSWLLDREEALRSSVQPPRGWYAPPQFADGSAPITRPTLSPPLLLPVESGTRNSYKAVYPPGPAGTVRTNIATGPYLVEVSGAQPVGRGPGGNMVVRLPASRHRHRAVEVRASWGAAMTAGRWLTVASLIVAAAAAIYAATRRRVREP